MAIDKLKRSKFEFIRFCLVGIFATGLHYAIYYLLNLIIDMNIAYTIGYWTAFLCNYLLTCLFTFRVKPSLKLGGGFGVSHLINWGLHLICLNIFTYIGLSPEWAPVPTYIICVPTNFLIIKFFFNKK
jgi:putative flippase GtrA